MLEFLIINDIMIPFLDYPSRRKPYLIAFLCYFGGNLVPVYIFHIAEKLVDSLCVYRRTLYHCRLDLFEIFRAHGITDVASLRFASSS